MEFKNEIVLYNITLRTTILKSGSGSGGGSLLAVVWTFLLTYLRQIFFFHIWFQIQMVQILTDHDIPTNKWSRAEDFTKWTVEHDGTVAWEEDVMLKTPASFFNPWALDQVKKAGSICCQKALYGCREWLLRPPWNCHKGYLLRIFKSFAMLITLFERQFSSLNPFDRINYHYGRNFSTNDECLG